MARLYYDVKFSGHDGRRRGDTIQVMQNAIETPLVFQCSFEDGEAYTFETGDVVTAKFVDVGGTAYTSTGTLTPSNGTNEFIWVRTVEDVGLPDTYKLTFEVVHTSGDPDYSTLVDYVIVDVPGEGITPPSPLVGVTVAMAAWLAVALVTVPDASDLITAADLTGKADKIIPATVGDFAALDAAGNLADSGSAAGDFDAVGSAAAAVAPLNAALIPVAIADLAAVSTGLDSIGLSWTYTAIGYIANFKLYRKTGLGGEYALINSPASGDTSYADSGLEINTEYYYRLDAYNPYFTTAGNEANATTDASLPLETLLLALPGVIGVWPADETSGTTIVEAGGNTALDGLYDGSIPLNAVAYPAEVGGASPSFQDTDDVMQMDTTAVRAAWDWQNGWLAVIFKQDVDGEHTLFGRIGNGGLIKLDLKTHGTIQGDTGYMRMTDPSVTLNWSQFHNDWTIIFARWSTVDNEYSVFVQGASMRPPKTYTGAGTVMGGEFRLGKIGGYRGGLGYIAAGAGSIPTDEDIDALYKAMYPLTNKSVFVCGDSWATDNDYWIDTVSSAMRTADGNAWREAPYRVGYSGQTAATIDASLAADIADAVITPDYILYAGSANDVTGGTAEAPFKVSIGGIIDTLQAKWPGVPIYLHSPYRDDLYDGSYDAACLNIHQWHADVIATKTNVFAGINGNVWFKTNIDTWSSDRVHPTEDAGRIEAAAQWVTILTA